MILFIGPPGCGKGTQSNFFKEKHNFDVFSFGNYLREVASKNFDNSKKILNLINEGKIVSPELVFENIDISIFTQKTILDGYPRTFEQAVFFDAFLKKNNLKITLIIEFSNQEGLINRILNRKVCKTCKKIAQNNICDCGSSNFLIRKDDNESVFIKRLSFYNENKNLIKDFYVKNKINYFVFDSFGEKKYVFNLLEDVFKKNNLI